MECVSAIGQNPNVAPLSVAGALRKRCPKQTSGPVANAGACPCKQINRLMEASAPSAMTLVAILVPAAVQFPSSRGPFARVTHWSDQLFPPAVGGQSGLKPVKCKQRNVFILLLACCLLSVYPNNRGYNYPKLSMLFSHVAHCTCISVRISSDLVPATLPVSRFSVSSLQCSAPPC